MNRVALLVPSFSWSRQGAAAGRFFFSFVRPGSSITRRTTNHLPRSSSSSRIAGTAAVRALSQFGTRQGAVGGPSSYSSCSSWVDVHCPSRGRRGSDSKRCFSNSSNSDKNKDALDTTASTTIQSMNAGHMTLEEMQRILDEEERFMLEAEKSKFVDNWKPGMKKRPLTASIRLEDFGKPGVDPADEQVPWTLRDKRTGLLAIKVGMVPVYDDTAWGTRYPCTVLHVHDNVVIGHKTVEKHGYSAIQIGAGQRKRKNVGVSVLGQYQHLYRRQQGSDDDLEDGFGDDDDDWDPPYLMKEFRVNPECVVPVGSKLHARHFVPGQNVDVSATSSGKGFQGGMKRHGFAGLPASHGVSKSHRSIGSTGQCQDPGKVFKGKKMPGRMGGVRVTTQNLRIVKVDRGRNLIYVLGSVPGKNGNFVEIRDAVKKPLWSTVHVPDQQSRPPLPTYSYDDEVDGSGNPGHEVFMPLPDTDPFAPDEEAA